MRPHVVAAIFARGGSKGLPRKNIKSLSGKPLIGWSIQAARESAFVDRIVVSTDDDEIADVARQCGAEVPFMRPRTLAADDAPEWLAWQHLVRTLSAQPGARAIDVLVSVPATAPLRTSEDVDACVRRLLEGDADVVLGVTPSHAHPSFNMVALDVDGTARMLMPRDGVHGRQAAPAVYVITGGVYATTPAFILSASRVFDGRVKTVTIEASRAIDVDTELDFRIAEFLMEERLRGHRG